MSQILLVGINSRYNHTCLAVRDLNFYLKKYLNADQASQVDYVEFTISENLLEVLDKISLYKPQVVLFSVYIWNAEFAFKVIREVKKVLPHVKIGAGGPEVSYSAKEVLDSYPEIDFIASGEGEHVLLELAQDFFAGRLEEKLAVKKIFSAAEYICNLDEIPFTYPELLESEKPEDYLSRIYYYESSRGCPFSCSYCLSSIDKSVRFKSLPKVFEELKIFIDQKIPLVKFVDRTFNLKEDRFIAIWEFIRDNWNGVSRFHFEIAAEYLSDRAIEVIKTMPAGSIQFEIGIQTTKQETLGIVGRKANNESLAAVIRKIPETVHVHLDLIAGLPTETISDFEQSFDYTMNLRPDMLQLGFLKVLSGTSMEKYAVEHGFRYLSAAPYEVLYTPDMSYEDLRFLKEVEKLLDIFYNSHGFEKSFDYLIESFEGKAFNLLRKIIEYAKANKSLKFENLHKTGYWFELLLSFVKENNFCETFDHSLFYDLLRFDFVREKKLSNFPQWYTQNYDKDRHHEALLKYGDMHSTRLAYASSHYEVFDYNPLTHEKKETGILFMYNREKEIETKIIVDSL